MKRHTNTKTEALTRSERVMRGKMGAEALHSQYDSKKLTENARAAAFERFELQVDPDGTLDPAERTRRARHAQREHMHRIAFLSARARRRGKDGRNRKTKRATDGRRK